MDISVVCKEEIAQGVRLESFRDLLHTLDSGLADRLCLQPVSREWQPYPSQLWSWTHEKERRSCRLHRWNLHFNFPFLILTPGSVIRNPFASILGNSDRPTSWRLTNGKLLLAYLQVTS